MYLTIRDPFQGFDRLNDSIFGPIYRRNGSEQANDWLPGVDIVEQKDRFKIQLELPGVDPKSVNAEVKGDVLTVSGEKQNTVLHEAGESVRLAENSYGKFQRSFRLKSVDNGQITAVSKFGVLSLEVPKKAESVARTIKIDVD
tara:strand:- start:2320 stop:2748 length:429 start_codon:yes stop_codon:yes gene_type:complete